MVVITLFFKPVTPPSQLNARDAIHGVQMAFVASVAVVTAAALVALLGVRPPEDNPPNGSREGQS
jgi:hypothetical protein